MDKSELSEQVNHAIASLQKHKLKIVDDGISTRSGSSKQDLFPTESDSVYVHIIVKKIWEHADLKFHKIRLPFPFREEKTTGVCLFVKDIDRVKLDPDVDKAARHFRDFLTLEKGVLRENLAQVIGLQQFKREYHTYEAKRKLCTAYDLFLVDDRVMREFGRNLGKSFYERKKVPYPIDIERGNVAARIHDQLANTVLTVKRHASSFCVKFGHLGQTCEELTSNFEAVMATVAEKLPGKIENIRSMYVATDKSPHLPVYASFESQNFVTLPPPPKKHDKPVEGDLSTLDVEEFGGAAKVRVSVADGIVQLLDQRGGEMRFPTLNPRKRKRKGNQKKNKKTKTE